MNPLETEKIELELFLEAIYQGYGYDFRQYTRASLRRRVRQMLIQLGRQRLSELIPSILYDEAFAQRVIYDFSITVTEMFRDPEFYRTVRKTITPYLQTYPFIKIWVAGCATGEEVYSWAILLKEEGLYNRATIYATDFNENALRTAAEGIYPIKEIQQYAINHQQSGGLRPFSEYYQVDQSCMVMDASLKTNLAFAHHNLVTDGIFNEVQVVSCRNVLIYFDSTLQSKVLNTLTGSLNRGGFLCLGNKESLEFSPVYEHFKCIDAKERIYQKRTS